MAIGSDFSIISNRKSIKTIYKLLGVLDLHTHIRLKPVIIFFQKYFYKHQKSQIRILELGCGSGINAFEVWKIAKKSNIDFYYVGVDFSFQGIDVANRILLSFQDNSNSKISFYQDDAKSFVEKYEGDYFDFILLADIIEHVENPKELLDYSKKILKDEGFFVVSVPTPLYPKIFGRSFHNQIGHLIDGYFVSQLDELFNYVKCRRVLFKYNTGIFSNIGCWLYYNKLNFNNRYLNFLKSLILYPFKFLDFVNNFRVSCSLFAIYKKQ